MTTQLQAVGNFSTDEIQVMQQTLAVGTTPAQFNLFVRTAAASGLNPFLNHIYCIVYGGKMSIQVSVEGIVFLAKRVEGYQGIDTQLVHANDEFAASIDKDGKWVIDEHKIKFPRGNVIAGYSIAYREGFKPFTVFMDVDEVQHNLTGTNSALWKKYFNDMFKKHITKRAAKGQFGIEISEDDAQVGSGEIQPYERKDITPEVEQAQQQPGNITNQGAPKEEQPEQTPQADAATLMKQANEKLKDLGVSGKADKQEYIANLVKFKGDSPSIAELTGLLKMLDMHIEEKKAQQAAADDELLGLKEE